MKLAAVHLALLLAGCAGQQRPPGAETSVPRRDEVIATVEVKMPMDAYTPTARALPFLHEIAGRVCGRHYRITDRRMAWDIEAAPVYLPAARMVRPGWRQAFSVVAKIDCLRRGPRSL